MSAPRRSGRARKLVTREHNVLETEVMHMLGAPTVTDVKADIAYEYEEQERVWAFHDGLSYKGRVVDKGKGSPTTRRYEVRYHQHCTPKRPNQWVDELALLKRDFEDWTSDSLGDGDDDSVESWKIPKFEVGQLVRHFWHGHVYPAVITKVKKDKGETLYQISSSSEVISVYERWMPFNSITKQPPEQLMEPNEKWTTIWNPPMAELDNILEWQENVLRLQLGEPKPEVRSKKRSKGGEKSSQAAEKRKRDRSPDWEKKQKRRRTHSEHSAASLSSDDGEQIHLVVSLTSQHDGVHKFAKSTSLSDVCRQLDVSLGDLSFACADSRTSADSDSKVFAVVPRRDSIDLELLCDFLGAKIGKRLEVTRASNV